MSKTAVHIVIIDENKAYTSFKTKTEYFQKMYLFFRDGQLKRSKPKKEWRERQQEEFSKRLKKE